MQNKKNKFGPNYWIISFKPKYLKIIYTTQYTDVVM